MVTKEESTEDGEKYEYGSTCTIEYGEEKNELGQYTLGQAKVLDMEDADVFALVGMLGKASAYFRFRIRRNITRKIRNKITKTNIAKT